MKASKKKIGIFGGTFNPVHNGHLSIATSFLASNYINSLWILLTPAPPHKKDDHHAPYALRLKMMRDAFKEMANVVISNVEQKLSSPSYTVNTLKYLSDLHPEHEFYLCMGKDSYRDFENWHRWENILDYCQLLVADRPIEEETSPPSNKKIEQNVNFVDHTPVDISSTMVRRRLGRNEPVKALIPASVLQTINRHKLYQ